MQILCIFFLALSSWEHEDSIDSHIPMMGGVLEPEEFIEKLIGRHDEIVAKQERL